MEKLEKFLDECVGNKYALSANKLLQAKTMKFSVKQSRKFVAEGRTFFCSELLAKGFKIIGVFEDKGEASSTYYPSHFTENGDKKLPIAEGCQFMEEINIIVIHDGDREEE